MSKKSEVAKKMKSDFSVLDSIRKKFGSEPKHGYKPDTSQRHPMLTKKYEKNNHGIK